MTPTAPERIPLLALPWITVAQRQSLPAQPGIYFVCNDTGRIMYIGSTIDLRQRIATHERLAQFRACLGCRIAWIAVAESLLLSMEASCIKYFEPVWNIKHLRHRMEPAPPHMPHPIPHIPHQVRIYFYLKTTGIWRSNKELAVTLQMSLSNTSLNTQQLVKLGILDQAEVFPGHRYRLSDQAAKRNKTYFQRLEQAAEIFADVLATTEAV